MQKATLSTTKHQINMQCFKTLIFLLCFVQTSFAQKEKLNIRPYTIATNFQNLSSHYDFLSPVQLDSSLAVKQLKDIRYKKTETSDLKLDTYIPEQKNNEKLPGVLLIHGGGWFSGEKENLGVLAQALAANGYVAVTPSYRLGGEAIYPAAVLDLKDALRWMRKNAKKLNLDVNRIATLGGSAGAQLAMQVGVTPDSEIYNEEGQEFSSAVQAIVNIDGVTTFVHPEVEKGPLLNTWLGGTYEEKSEIWKEASPIEYVNSKTPPTLFINSAQPRFHGGRDSYIDLLDQYNIYSEVHTLKDTPHAFWLVNPWFQTTLRYTLDFLDKFLKEPYTPPYRTIKVARNDQADFSSIQDAINSVRVFGPGEVLIEIAAGVYKEKIVIPSHITKLTLKGSDREKTIISYNDHTGKIDELTKKEHGTFSSHTLLVQGTDVHLENLTIQNTSCNDGQAVALHVEGDRFVAVNCKILGCQDTLYAAKEGSRQYYEQCFIQGTTDFIFGQAIAVFQDCTIKSLTDSYITAAATPRNQEFGFVFYKCKLIADKDVTKVFLGRPWRPYAKTVFINTEMGAQILEEGWHSWPGDSMFPEKEKTAYYAEYESRGAGASPENRVEWSHQLGKWEIEQYSLRNIFNGWIPAMYKH
ncbi:pectinesterase family protein [Zunongwangia sp. HRR-M8]|uniref:pectinesterase family protein n=1 Tax=Zunongwangia sp. HRR-M8 TaxID=3015170 RepID=UPI0022DD871E|nr:pectinesterase family protein [Zunongwangia sp. HRR-M8]WBL22739.1 pectinesterase family protein [Zunongwangia sp. HRR-M8]